MHDVRVPFPRPRARSGAARRARPSLVVLGVAATVLLALAGCGTSGADLAGRTYVSTTSRGHELVPGSSVTLTFTDGSISANAGCNTMNGSASWDGDTLEVTGPLASTMMGCEADLMAQDEWLAQFLASSPGLSVDGDELTLGDDATGLTFTQSA